MATVQPLVFLSIFLLTVNHFATYAWPVAPGPATIAPAISRGILDPNTQLDRSNKDQAQDVRAPLGRDVSPLLSADSYQKDQSARQQSFNPSSSQINDRAQVNSPTPSPSSSGRPTHHNINTKPISQSSLLSSGGEESLNKAINSFPHNAPSKQNSSEWRIDKSYLDSDRVTEGSGMGPSTSSTHGKKHESKLDDTEESEDDDEDYDETLDSGSGHGLNKPSTAPSMTPELNGAHPSRLQEKPAQNDFYKPFRPPPPLLQMLPSPVVPSSGPTNLMTPDVQQKHPTSNVAKNVSTVMREGPNGEVAISLNNYNSSNFVITTPPPRVSTISTLVSPSVSRGESLLNRTKSEVDEVYEDEEETEDEDTDETSAFEDNDTSEVDATANSNKQPTPILQGSSTISLNNNQPSRPIGDRFNQSSKAEGPIDILMPSGRLNFSTNTAISPGLVVPYASRPPSVLARPITTPSATLPATSSAPIGGKADGGGSGDEEEDEDEEEEVEEDEEEDEELDKEVMQESAQTQPTLSAPSATRKPSGIGINNNNNLPMGNPGNQPARVPVAMTTTSTTTQKPSMTVQNLPSIAVDRQSGYQFSKNRPPPLYSTATTTTMSPLLIINNNTNIANHQPAASGMRQPINMSAVPMTTTTKPVIVPTAITPPSMVPIIITSSTMPTIFQHAAGNHLAPPVIGAHLTPTSPQPPNLMPTTTTAISGSQTTGLVYTPPPVGPIPNTFLQSEKPRSHFTTLNSEQGEQRHQRPYLPPPMQPPTQSVTTNIVQPYDRDQSKDHRSSNGGDNNHIESADDDTLTKQIYDKALEVYHEADKTVKAAWEAVWPPNVNFDSATIEPLLSQPLFFMLALGGAIICLVLLMMLVVYIISYQIAPRDDDISIY